MGRNNLSQNSQTNSIHCHCLMYCVYILFPCYLFPFISLLFVIIHCLYLLFKSNQTVEAAQREWKSFIHFCLFSIWLQKPEKILSEKNGFVTNLYNIYHATFFLKWYNSVPLQYILYNSPPMMEWKYGS